MQGRSRFGGSGAWMFDCMAAAIQPLPLTQERCRILRERILACFAARQQSATTVRAAEGEWLPLAPGVSIKLLRRDGTAGNMTAYIRMAPGASLESHVHAQTEECLILQGEIFIGAHRVSAGDMHVAAAGTAHAAISSPRGALLLVRAEDRQAG